MDNLVEVTIEVEAAAAEALADARTRAEIGRLVSDLVRARATPDPLRDIMERMSAEAARRGLTQEILDEELAAYNAERRTTG